MSSSPRKALITGAGRGIGKAIALELAASGHHVCLLSRTETELKEVCAEIEERGGRASYLCFDLCDTAGYAELKAQVEQQLGRVDVLVHNAAPTYRPAKLTRMAP